MLALCSTLNLATLCARLHSISIFLHFFVPLSTCSFGGGAVDKEGYTPPPNIDPKAPSNNPECFFFSRECIAGERLQHVAVGFRNTTVSRTENRGAFLLFLIFLVAVLSAAAVYLLSHRKLLEVRCGSHGTASAALRGLLLATATNRASLCVYVCVRIVLSTSWTFPTHTSSAFERHPRSTTAVQQQQQQSQRYNTSELYIDSYL